MSGSSDRSVAYIARFRCLGPRCEDTCCQAWRPVELDARSHDRLIEAARLTSAVTRKRLRQAVAVVEQDGRRYALQPRPGEDQCALLEPDGACLVHATFGPALLPDRCATYPRTILQVGEHLELTGDLSCPEIARQLLLAPDATDPVPLPVEALPRRRPSGGMDPRDLRPYFRHALLVRDRFVALLRDGRLGLDERLFVVAFFAKRLSDLVTRETARLGPRDEEALAAELARLDDPSLVAEVARRFEAVQPPAVLALLVARELARAPAADGFRRMVEAVFASAVELAGAGAEGAPTAARIEEVFAAYQRRKAALRSRLAARVDQYFANHAIDYWLRHLPVAAPELLTHCLRQLGQLAVHKLLLYSHPAVARALDHASDGDAAQLCDEVDRVAVEVFYRTARHVEHTPLFAHLEEALAARDLRSLAGAAALVRF